MSSNVKKQFLTHGLVVVGFFICTVIIYLPFFTKGEQVSQHDIMQAVGSSNQIHQYNEETGENALWNNYMFSGMPSFLTGLRYTGDLLVYVYIFLKAGLPNPVGITFIGFICFYTLLITFGVRPWIAFLGSIVFGLNGFNIISITAGHNAKIAAAVLAPLVLSGIHLAFNNRRLLGIAVTALGLGLHIRVGHPQITYYLLLIVIAYGISQLVQHWKANTLKSFGLTILGLILAAALGLLANTARLWTTYEYSQYTIRGKSELSSDKKESSGLDKEYAFRYSNDLLEPLFLFVPNIMGGSSSQALDLKSSTAEAFRQAGYGTAQIKQQIQSIPTYWGNQPLTAPFYAGSILLLLFVLGTMILPKSQSIWMISIAAVGIMLSWGSNFSAINNFLFDYLPFYNKFRSVTFTIFITLFGLNLLGFISLEKLWAHKEESETQQKFYKAFYIAGGFLLLIVIGAGALNYHGAIDSRLPDWLTSAIRDDRKSLLRSDALRALLFLFFFTGLIWAHIKKYLRFKLVLPLILLVSFIDIYGLSRRFLNSDSFQKKPISTNFKASEADQIIQKNTNSGDRVLNLANPFNDAYTSYFHESIGGYHGAKIRRYQDVISYYLESEVNQIIQQLQNGSRNLGETPILNMLNTTYFKAGTQKNTVFKNVHANGNAWLVSDVLKVNSPDEEIEKLGSIDTKSEAVVDASQFNVSQYNGSGTIEITSRNPNTITYTAELDGKALAIFSEMYYPKGWKAYVDGQEAEIIRADYILRAIELNSGNHEIKFEFKPTSYHIGTIISIVSGILIISLIIGVIIFEFK